MVSIFAFGYVIFFGEISEMKEVSPLLVSDLMILERERQIGN